jgi:hypothetical protein
MLISFIKVILFGIQFACSSFLSLHLIFAFAVGSVHCCIYLSCCKLLPEGISVISSNRTIWHVYELDLPALLSKEARSWSERRSK